ncbi:tripartite tricarboxylate transporter substrate binding protein [Ottowia sp.]|jgi:tripartite-type tricarboxylate transporter receptor subunit TctC|uniref:Bug family tripartite tricarboxylate transporter substrate binding protein n=1 Tax=Ottowia sp. TaxID=1898956 RepID=UPI0025F6D289|nr:tripartite tricarboxylate transporter substrate binding protein [Ottowia sp.]MBK6612868.1 tripartite tricarboxylate transporter substrate binding protein [Ottowia sp.]MBK6747998.1 tripartite tricarboxylate transporter substrate binding protein [Ottowia sp.]
MTRIHRRQFMATATAVAAAAAPGFSLAQAGYPNKPVKIIVPLPAGGAADAGARIVSAHLQTLLKQPVVIDNKPGGSYVIGVQATVSAPADGYTLIAVNTGMAAAQATMKRYDLLKSLTPITQIGLTPCLLVVSTQSKFTSMAELIAYGKANPGKLNFGSVGIGSLEHLWVSMFSKAAGIEVTHVPFKGMPDALVALAQGEIQFIPAVLPAAAPFIEKKAIRPLGLLSDKRNPGTPDIPTLKEQGFNVPPMEFWSGYAVAAGTPAPVVERLRRELTATASDPAVKEKFAGMSTTVVISNGPTDFAKLIGADLRWMATTAKAADIRLE